ncbi:MAG: hypothetical protein QXS91_01420 [Candidatus Anstonellales archaeon]
MEGNHNELLITWKGERAGLIANNGEVRTFQGQGIKHTNEKPLHRLIKHFLYENPFILSREPFITAMEVCLTLHSNNNGGAGNIGIIDIMILEEKNEIGQLKGTFIEVKSSYDIRSRIERMKRGDIYCLNQYLKQIAQHMAALRKYFIFSKDESRYMLAYPIADAGAINEFYETFSSMFPKNDKERAVHYLINNIDAYIGFLEINEDEISIYKIKDGSKSNRKKFNILKHFSRKNSLVAKLFNLFREDPHTPYSIEESSPDL